MVSYWKLADLTEWQNNSCETRTYWTHTFDVVSGIDKQGLHLSPEDREVREALRRQVLTEAR